MVPLPVTMNSLHYPVSNVYAVVMSQPSDRDEIYTSLSRQMEELHGDVAQIWDGIAEALTLMYGHYHGKEVPDAVFAELVDVYLGNRGLLPEFQTVLTEFVMKHRGAIQEMIAEITRRGERIQATYPALHHQPPSGGFMIFECVHNTGF